MARTKVFIIDDSALMRELLTEILAGQPDLDVVGAARDPYDAWDKMRKLRPDVVTLDVEMPRMDGLTFLEKLMRVHPMPVVMISSLTERGCQTTIRALELGAVDFVTKPMVDMRDGTVELADEIVAKVRAAAAARMRPRPGWPARGNPGAPAPARTPTDGPQRIIAIGASTGGTQAIEEVLVPLPPDAPGIVVVQHMPANFTKSFAERLDKLCVIHVTEARDGDRVVPGHALIAPGDFHMRVTRSGGSFAVKIERSEPVSRHRPSVDVLFQSCADSLASNAVGVILTGMGNDGAKGMLAMQQAGARTVAQDEATCVVFGMPREAIAAGGVDEVQPIERVAETALRLTTAAV